LSISENRAAPNATHSLLARPKKRHLESRESQLFVVVRRTLRVVLNLSKAAIPVQSNRLDIGFVSFINFTLDDFSDTL